MTENEYDRQANEFLAGTGTKFECAFEAHRKYFDDDKPRDVYRITLTRGAEKYSFTFGQSLHGTGAAPRPYDVLSCLTKSDPGTFADFCAEYGYGMERRSALKTYRAVRTEWNAVARLFADVLEYLAEIN